MQVVFSSSAILVTHITMWLSVVQTHCDLGLLSAGQAMAEKRAPDAAVTSFPRSSTFFFL